MRATAVAIVFMLAAVTITAAVPETMSYQGVLRDDIGAVVPDDEYLMVFTLYDAEFDGNSVWTESQTVDVLDGIFSVILGEFDSVDASFDKQYWLEIEVSANTLSPRVKLASAPYALRAAVADSILGGIPEGDDDWEINGTDIWHEGDVGIGAGSADPVDALEVRGKVSFYNDLDVLGRTQFSDDVGISGTLSVAGAGGIVCTAPFSCDGTITVDGFKMSTGASDGYILVTNAMGTGTWQQPPASGDEDWVINGTDVWHSGNVAVGPGSAYPSEALEVEGNILVHGNAVATGTMTVNQSTQLESGLAVFGPSEFVGASFSGSVGIGTGIPAHALDVTGDAGVQGVIHVGGQVLSTLPGGLAPVVVTSTTECTNLNADMVDGYGAGNGSGEIAVSNGTVCTNLNADMLDGYSAGNDNGQVAVSNGAMCDNLNADMLHGDVPGNSSGDLALNNLVLCVNLNADMIDGYSTGNSGGQIPISNGTVCTNLNADKLGGYSAGSFRIVRDQGTVWAGDTYIIVIPHYTSWTLELASGDPVAGGVCTVTGFENDYQISVVYSAYNGDGTTTFSGGEGAESSSATLVTFGSGSSVYTVECPDESLGDHNLILRAPAGSEELRYSLIY